MKEALLDLEQIRPYVRAVFHQQWRNISELYVTFQKIDQSGASHPNGIHSDPLNPLCTLGLVVATYYAHTDMATIYLSRDGAGHMPGYTLWNGKMSVHEFRGSPYEDLLYDLKRVYKALNARMTTCTTQVFPPSAHDIADATMVVEMVRRWSLQK